MALVLTAQQARVLIAFRRSSMSRELYEIAVEILDARREAYEETPATEALRLDVADAKSTLNVLFEAEIEVAKEA